MRKINAQEKREIAAKTGCDERTVRRVYTGRRCLPATRMRIERAAKEIGAPPPPGPVIRIEVER